MLTDPQTADQQDRAAWSWAITAAAAMALAAIVWATVAQAGMVPSNQATVQASPGAEVRPMRASTRIEIQGMADHPGCDTHAGCVAQVVEERARLLAPDPPPPEILGLDRVHDAIRERNDR